MRCVIVRGADLYLLKTSQVASSNFDCMVFARLSVCSLNNQSSEIYLLKILALGIILARDIRTGEAGAIKMA